MDLSPKEKRKSAIPFGVVFLFLMAAIGYMTVRLPSAGEHAPLTPGVQNARPIGLEEKQTVVFVLDQLEGDVPKLVPAIREIRGRVLDRPAWVVEREMETPSIIWNTTQGIFFSFRFFTSDLYTQSNALLKIIDPGHMHLVFRPDALVKLPD